MKSRHQLPSRVLTMTTAGLAVLFSIAINTAAAIEPDIKVRCTQGVQQPLPAACQGNVCEGYTDSLRGVDVFLTGLGALIDQHLFDIEIPGRADGDGTILPSITLTPDYIEVWPELQWWDARLNAGRPRGWTTWKMGDRFQIADHYPTGTWIYNVTRQSDACHLSLRFISFMRPVDVCDQYPDNLWHHFQIVDGYAYRVKLWTRAHYREYSDPTNWKANYGFSDFAVSTGYFAGYHDATISQRYAAFCQF